jgi:hypothetical protein
MQNIIQIYPCLLKLSRKQDTILNIGDFSTKNYLHFLSARTLYYYGNIQTMYYRNKDLAYIDLIWYLVFNATFSNISLYHGDQL